MKIKKIIREFIPKYIFFNNKNQNNISIHGTRRGATTFLAELISDNSTRLIDQPLEMYPKGYYSKIRNLKLKFLPYYENSVFINLCNNDKKSIKFFLKSLLEGKHSYFDLNFGISKKNVLFKNCNANYLLPLYNSLGIKTIILFRHPYTQSLSCLRNNWGHVYQTYFNSSFFIKKYLSNQKLKEIKYLEDNMSEIEKYILDWYCNNAEILKSYDKYFVLYHEDFFNDFELTVNSLENFLDKKINRTKRFKPSATSNFSDKTSFDNLLESQLELFENIEPKLKNKISYLFKILNINIYSMESPLPLSKLE